MDFNPHVKLLIVVPAFNESGNIQKTLADILALGPAVSILVVDDGSQDQTAHEARSLVEQEGARGRVFVTSLPFNLGIGGAVQTGFRYCLLKGFDMMVQVDGDGQHDVSYIGKLTQPIIDNRADMVVGSRFLPPHLGYRSSLVRRLGINFFAHLISLLTGFKVSDPTSGFRAYNAKMIRLFARYYPHDFPEPEAIMVARRFGGRLVEVAVEMRKRQGGYSSIRYLRTLYYMIKVTCAVLLDMLKKNEAPEKEGGE